MTGAVHSAEGAFGGADMSRLSGMSGMPGETGPMRAPGTEARRMRRRGSRPSLGRRWLAAAGKTLAGLALPVRAIPPSGPDGVLEIGSEEFRRVCAITRDGDYHIVRDYHTDHTALELEQLADRYILPPKRRLVPATLDGIARMRGEAVVSTTAVASGMSGGARRIRDAIAEAAALRASDLKIVQRSRHAELRLRVGHEELTWGPEWQPEEAAEAIAWLFDGRDFGDGASTQQAGLHQEFSIGRESHVRLPDSLAALRGIKGPHGNGHEFVVLRLFHSTDTSEAGRIEDLGLEADVLDALAEERQSSSGLAIVSGSTGDGKSTTLVRLLERLYQDRGGRVSILTVEDPVEYPIAGAGIVQLPVESAAQGDARAAAFARVLRTFVRSNPDVGMVSEIRTADDAREILQFAISGHKIFTTIHSFSALAVLFRLISLGLDSRDIAEPGVVSLVMRQTLVPALCRDCARPTDGREREIAARWTRDPRAAPMRRNREGCPTCRIGRSGEAAQAAWAGLARKRATAEFIRLDDTFRKLVEARDAHGARDYWLTPRSEGGMGGITLQDRLRALVARGEVDFDDIAGLRFAEGEGRAAANDPRAPVDVEATFFEGPPPGAGRKGDGEVLGLAP